MEYFISFEIAKKLKENGFDYPCVGHYVNNQLYIAHFINAFHSDKNESIGAPTISQVLKWLREEKDIHIEFFLYNGKYSYFVKRITKICEEDLFHQCLNEDTTEEEYDTYEEAELAGIEYVLDNLI